MNTGGFQTQVGVQPAFAVAGDRASMNPIFMFDIGAGGLVAGPSGVTVGRFAWVAPPTDPEGTPAIANSFGAGVPAGFVMRNQQALNSTYLSFAGMTIAAGFQMALVISGDFWVVNDGTSQATRGMKAYADLTTGKVSFAAASSPTTGASATGSTITPTTLSVTGSIGGPQGNILTVTAVGSGTVVPGATITGGTTASGTKVVSQLTPLLTGETAGGVGRYYVSIPEQTVASGTITGTYGLLTVGTLTTTPAFQVGNKLNATGSVVAGTTVTQSVTGSGGTGATLVVDNNTNVGSQTISAVSNVETPWVALSSGLAGELVKIGSTSTQTSLS